MPNHYNFSKQYVRIHTSESIVSQIWQAICKKSLHISASIVNQFHDIRGRKAPNLLTSTSSQFLVHTVSKCRKFWAVPAKYRAPPVDGRFRNFSAGRENPAPRCNWAQNRNQYVPLKMTCKIELTLILLKIISFLKFLFWLESQEPNIWRIEICWDKPVAKKIALQTILA